MTTNDVKIMNQIRKDLHEFRHQYPRVGEPTPQLIQFAPRYITYLLEKVRELELKLNPADKHKPDKRNFIEILVNGNIKTLWDGRAVKCKKCNASIGFGVTERGKKMPFDMVQIEKMVEGKTMLIHRAHWATCSDPESFK